LFKFSITFWINISRIYPLTGTEQFADKLTCGQLSHGLVNPWTSQLATAAC